MTDNVQNFPETENPLKCTEKFKLSGLGCLKRDYEEPEHSSMYAEKALSACKHLCQTVDDSTCSTIVHVPSNRTCLLTQWKTLYEILTNEEDLDSCRQVYIYNRTRCTGNNF